MRGAYRMPKKYRTARKYKGKCEKCGTKTGIDNIFSYVDESNISITHNAPYLCRDCYNKAYGKK